MADDVVPGATSEGWVPCGCGFRHWGRSGAAGLLVQAQDHILLQHRAAWSSDGGTWGLPGGAHSAGESFVDTALREAAEETGLDRTALTLTGSSVLRHPSWSYTTVVAEAATLLPVRAADAESIDVRWVPKQDIDALPLHPGFADAWPLLRVASGVRLYVAVDIANVMGSRPDGWWHDRAGAAARLLGQLAAWANRPLPDGDLPAGLVRPALDAWFVSPLAVVEGAARDVQGPRREPPLPALRVVAARGDGDDALVSTVEALEGPVLAVTADRALRERLIAAGATVTGPGWLLERLDGSAGS